MRRQEIVRDVQSLPGHVKKQKPVFFLMPCSNTSSAASTLMWKLIPYVKIL